MPPDSGSALNAAWSESNSEASIETGLGSSAGFSCAFKKAAPQTRNEKMSRIFMRRFYPQINFNEAENVRLRVFRAVTGGKDTDTFI